MYIFYRKPDLFGRLIVKRKAMVQMSLSDNPERNLHHACIRRTISETCLYVLLMQLQKYGSWEKWSR